ncbi:MAG: hypothetical protein F6J87_15195 [Spirulina sp. SIO3F2]|nr:hypothetical protein [Spirulina sp. SIO3F2]
MANPQAIFIQKVTISLLLLLFFTVSLIALGYSVALSVFLGLLGASSGAFIVGWWYDDRPVVTPEGEVRQPKASRTAKKKANAPGIVEAQKLRREAEQSRQRKRQQQLGSGKQRSLFAEWLSRFRRFR